MKCRGPGRPAILTRPHALPGLLCPRPARRSSRPVAGLDPAGEWRGAPWGSALPSPRPFTAAPLLGAVSSAEAEVPTPWRTKWGADSVSTLEGARGIRKGDGGGILCLGVRTGGRGVVA